MTSFSRGRCASLLPILLVCGSALMTAAEYPGIEIGGKKEPEYCKLDASCVKEVEKAKSMMKAMSAGKCCGDKCSSTADCASNLFCCPNCGKCMDVDTASTAGPNCKICGGRGGKGGKGESCAEDKA